MGHVDSVALALMRPAPTPEPDPMRQLALSVLRQALDDLAAPLTVPEATYLRRFLSSPNYPPLAAWCSAARIEPTTICAEARRRLMSLPHQPATRAAPIGARLVPDRVGAALRADRPCPYRHKGDGSCSASWPLGAALGAVLSQCESRASGAAVRGPRSGSRGPACLRAACALTGAKQGSR
jgi:hypothetical protein